MSDDQDGCEWVSFSSGTGLPGVVPNQRPLHSCVCACKYATIKLQKSMQMDERVKS